MRCRPWPCRCLPVPRMGTRCPTAPRLYRLLAMAVAARSRPANSSGAARPANLRHALRARPVSLLLCRRHSPHQQLMSTARSKSHLHTSQLRRRGTQRLLHPRYRPCHNSRPGKLPQQTPPPCPLPQHGQRPRCRFRPMAARHRCLTQLGLVGWWIVYSSICKGGSGHRTTRSCVRHSRVRR